MNVEQEFNALVGPLVGPDGRATEHFVQLLLKLWVRTGSAPGVDSAELEIFTFLTAIRPAPPSADAVLSQAALLALGLANAPQPPPDLSQAMLFALMMSGRSGAALSVTAGGTTAVITTAEALSTGNVVNVFASSGAKVQKANATDRTKPADGFVTSAYGSGVGATVQFFGPIITGLSLTAGARYWLDTTGGGLTTTPPSADGNIIQEVGVAVSSGALAFQPKGTVQL